LITDATADRAAFYRASLYLGLVRGETIIAWADSLLKASSTPGRELIELAMTPSNDLTAQAALTRTSLPHY
jgi:hypothetical protein